MKRPWSRGPVTVDTTTTAPLEFLLDEQPPEPARARHARRTSPWRWIAPTGGMVALAVTMVFAGYGIFTVFAADRPRAAAVAPRTEEPPSDEPVEVTPSRTGRTGADRARKRSPRPVLVVPTPRKTHTWSPSHSPKPSSSAPSPTPRRSSASPTPTSTTTSPSPTGSTSPTATATASNGKLGAPDVR